MRSPRRPFLVLLALALLTADRPGRAADSWPVTRGPSREPDPYRYDAGQWQSVPKEFLEDAAACVLYAGNTYLVEPDGTVENVTHEITRLNGRKGIEKLGEYRHITYDPAYQKLTLNEANLHKRDGRTVAVEPRHLQLRDVSTDYQVYDHEKQLIISFPNLEVGDTLEVKWTIRGKNPEHGGRFFTRYDFGDPGYPVVLDQLRVRVPAAMPFKYAATSGRVDPVISEAGGQRSYDWKVRNTPQLPRDENLPPKEDMRPSVVCSTFPSWEEIGRWKQKLRADSWASSPEIRKVVADVTRGLTEPAAKARALTFWMRRNIRYVSSGERHDYTPHPPSRVFNNRFGDCKDTSQLLAVMMREAGLNVSLATLGTLDDGQVVEAVPSPWGTHAILAVTLADGEHWVDTTLSLGGWDYLPREDRNRVCYIVDPEGRVSMRRTPPPTADANRYEQTTNVYVAPDGSSRCERTVATYGDAALGQRDNFVEVPAGERRRQVAAELQEANTRARLLRLSVDEAALQDFDRPVTSQMTFEIPGHFNGSPEREGAISDNRTWARLLAYNLDYDRQAPFEIPTPFESRHRYVVHVPPSYALDEVPAAKTITSSWGRFEVQVKPPSDKGSVRELELTFVARLDKTRVEPAQFAEYRRFQEEVTKAYRVWLTLKPSSDPADVPALEAVLAATPDDCATAAALARLYTRLGKADDARRVLRRACQAKPDDPALCELVVQCAATPDEEEVAQRELVRRFPSEARHQLTLGSLLVQRGKYDAARTVLTPLANQGGPTDSARAHFLLARAAAAEPAEALEHLDAAEEADPECVKNVQALLLRGRVCEELGRAADAGQAYRKALAVDRDAADALNGLVRLSLAADARADALEYLRRYAVLAGDDAARLLRAAEYYLRLTRYEEAADLARKAGRKGPDARVERVLGLVHLRRGEHSLALAHLEKASVDAETVGGSLRAMLAVGVVAGLGQRLEQVKALKDAPAETRRVCADAVRVLERRQELERLAPPPAGREAEWGRALDCLACAEYARSCGRPADAVDQLLGRAFVGADGPGPAFALRGRLALEAGKLTRAAGDALKAVALCPKDGLGYFVRGRVRIERAEAGGLEDLERAAELTRGTDADVLHALADALFRAGKTDRAVTVQREAARLKPQDREIVEQLTAFEKAVRPTGAGG
jgi:tetratricopeptide (TPR) repeat protein/transglutaminase-like putative cysteine protease